MSEDKAKQYLKPGDLLHISGYKFEMLYPSGHWSGTMFLDEDPRLHMPAEQLRNVRELYEVTR